MKVSESEHYRELLITLSDIKRIEIVFEQFYRTEIDSLEARPAGEYKRATLDKSASFSASLNLSFSCENTTKNVQFLYDAPEFLERTCDSIAISFSSSLNKKRASISIVSGSGFRSGIAVNATSGDKQFVNAFLKSISDTIGSFRPQTTFVKRFIGIINAPAAISIAALFDYIYTSFIHLTFFVLVHFVHLSKTSIDALRSSSFINPALRHPNVYRDLVFVFSYLWSLAVAIPLWIFIEKQIRQMYPSIEFDFGPGHLRDPLRARRRIYFVLGSVLLPLFLSIAANLL